MGSQGGRILRGETFILRTLYLRLQSDNGISERSEPIICFPSQTLDRFEEKKHYDNDEFT